MSGLAAFVLNETADAYELTGIVARAAALSAIPDAPLKAWRRNLML